jgi:hypothetical protein
MIGFGGATTFEGVGGGAALALAVSGNGAISGGGALVATRGNAAGGAEADAVSFGDGFAGAKIEFDGATFNELVDGATVCAGATSGGGASLTTGFSGDVLTGLVGAAAGALSAIGADAGGTFIECDAGGTEGGGGGRVCSVRPKPKICPAVGGRTWSVGTLMLLAGPGPTR